MTAWLAVGAVLAFGWGLAALAGRQQGIGGGLVDAVLWGGLAITAWMSALDLLAVAWRGWLLAAPGVVVALVALLAGKGPVRERAQIWGVAAAIVVAVRAAMIAAVPAFGWDLRYLWGLKARVFALAGGYDAAWLAWPGHAFTHPAYPPLWSDLLAAGVLLGGSVPMVAAAWQAVICLALGAACWRAAGPAPASLRALAAVAGGLGCGLFAWRYSGYADPLVALMLVAAVDALARTGRGRDLPVLRLAVVVAGLALCKQEGIALALGVAVAGVVLAGLRRAAPLLAAGLLAVGWWGLLVGRAGVAAWEYAVGPATVLHHLLGLPAGLRHAATPVMIVLLVLWAFALPGLAGRALRGVRVVVAVWGFAALGAYLTTTVDLAWHLGTSLDRVLATPLPAVLAVGLASWAERRTPRSDAHCDDVLQSATLSA